MTSGRPGDWDEDRLAAAFAARAASTPPTPSDLVQEVGAATATARGDGTTFGWPRLAVAAGSLVVVLVVAGSLVLRPNQPVPGASTPPGSGNPTRSGDPLSPVLAAIGEPMSVSDAVAIRDAGDDSREIAVAGFLSPEPVLRCPYESKPRNPTRLWCSAAMQWVMEQPEQLWGPSAGGDHQPTGPAFNPSFAVVEQPVLAMPATDDDLPVPVVLMGHFDDRRARLCVTDKDGCADTFVVDRVVSFDGATPGTTTMRNTEATPRDSEIAVDALVAATAPGSVVLSRQLLPVADAIDVEPLLGHDQLIPFTDPSKLAWIVTAADVVDGAPMIRTFMLLDGSSWFAEIDAAVVRRLEWPVPVASDGPVQPSSQPDAFVGAPEDVLGIRVQDIAALERHRQTLLDEGGRDEVALRAWYVGPDPSVTCEDQPPFFHEPRPPCDEARHWLLDDPSQFGIMQGQIRRDPSTDHFPPVLNPLLPIDVAFDVGSTWQGSTPAPVPVIVLGHFEDMRVDSYAGNLYFVIDSLAWTPGRTVGSLDTVVRLTPNATEDVSSVLARIDAISSNAAVATWATVVDAANFLAVDRRAESMPEFTSGAPIWMVARLVPNEMDGRERLAVVWAFTADGGTRVWADACPDCSPDLATSLNIHDLDANTPLVRVLDYELALAAAGAWTGAAELAWQHPNGNTSDWIWVARGQNNRQVVVRWKSAACLGAWEVTVHQNYEDRTYISLYAPAEECDGDPILRRLVLEFKEPVDIDKVDGPSCCG